LIIFDATNKHSFDSITRWVTEIQNASTDGREVILYIVANKTDLNDIRQVSRDDVRQFISSNNVRAEEAEVSAKENRGIAEVFDAIARKIAERGRQPVSQR
jgi:GTPase SAR1 family protein